MRKVIEQNGNIETEFDCTEINTIYKIYTYDTQFYIEGIDCDKNNIMLIFENDVLYRNLHKIINLCIKEKKWVDEFDYKQLKKALAKL